MAAAAVPPSADGFMAGAAANAAGVKRVFLALVPPHARRPLAAAAAVTGLVALRRAQLALYRPPNAAIARRANLGQALPVGRDAAGAAASVMVQKNGNETYIRRWDARGAPRGTVLLVHGLAWHSGYFQALAQCLSVAGWDVVSYGAAPHVPSPASPCLVSHPSSAHAPPLPTLTRALFHASRPRSMTPLHALPTPPR